MSTKYITAAQRDAMLRRLSVYFDPCAPIVGVIGTVCGDDYYVVPDDDPRLQSAEPISDTETPK